MGEISSLLGSVVNATSSYFGAKKQREWEEEQASQQQAWNEQMMDKQNQFNMNMWNLNNQYNDPSAQYQRMLFSGYNPLFYGPEGSGNSSAMESAQPLGFERAANVQNPLLAGVQSFLQSLQIQSQARANIANAKNSEANAEYTNARTLTENLMRGINFDLAGLDIDLKNADIRLSQSQAEKNSADIVRINKECDEIDVKIKDTLVSMDVKKRSQALQEIAFEFEKEIRGKELSLDEQRVAVQWFNANVNSLLVDSQVDVNSQQKIYLDIQGDHIVAVTRTENDSRSYVVEKAKWDAKNSQRDYKWKPVNNTIKAVGTAVGAFGIAVGSVLKATSLSAGASASSAVAGSQYMSSPVGYD